jgi:hypothetical protein
VRNIFGGFTPAEWESTSIPKFKADPNLKSFLFSMNNPQNFSAAKFALMNQNQSTTIDYGP